MGISFVVGHKQGFGATPETWLGKSCQFHSNIPLNSGTGNGQDAMSCCANFIHFIVICCGCVGKTHGGKVGPRKHSDK